MSEAAQAVQQAVNEMKSKRVRGKKTNGAKAKVEKQPKKAKPVFETLPDLSELRLVTDGIRTEKANRYVNIEFTNGFKLRLFPVGFKPKDVQKASEFVVSWLKNRAS